jgi:RNA recognition motif-containing protein
MDQAERDEKEKLLQKDQPAKPQKRTFDAKAIMLKKAAEEEIAAQVKVEDPFAVKLTNVPGSVTEQDLRAILSKFGTIENIYIPTQDGAYSRSMKMAIVRYKHKDEATRAIQEQEVNIAFSMVQIERAL